MSDDMKNIENCIAVVGMSGQFPGAKNLNEFWENLLAGKVAGKELSEKDLIDKGVATERFKNPNYVKMAYMLDDFDKFDADFFDINPREAEFIDPQQRLFLQTAWQALEQAGYTDNPDKLSMGVFAGASLSGYFVSHFADGWADRDLTTGMQIQIGNDKDYICTRTSYKLDLKGPSVNVQAACSTSLVAVCQAYDSLMNYQCDVALAGGVTVRVPHEVGYMYDEGGIFSPDGYCRSFDEGANGTVFGSGVGVVVLRRLEDAIKDGDHIHAVIKGAAVNNDGAVKIGFTAPSARGQAEVISVAQALADVDASSIQYAEAHGTGTHLGDPIEISALTEVFRESTENKTYCAIGSVKSNIGHLEAAAGIASFIKTSMALEHAVIPPSPLYKSPNPQIDFENSPFFVNKEPETWKDKGAARRACVSSFGIGGTNSHIIMEQAPELKREPIKSRGGELFVISAKNEDALADQINQYVHFLKKNPDLLIEDVCYTSGSGRSHFVHRLSVSCISIEDLINKLEKYLVEKSAQGVNQSIADESKISKRAFLCTGQGSQYAGMAQTLYNSEPIFRNVLDRCNDFLCDELKRPLLDVMFNKENSGELDETGYTQPALYALETGLAALWISWGIKPDAVLGHSVGEYAAAQIAGVFSLEDGLKLIAARARLMQALPSGGQMAALMTSAERVEPLLKEHEKELSLAAINGANSVVISGAANAVTSVCKTLKSDNVKSIKLTVSHAFHSPLMDPMLEEFHKVAQSISYLQPELQIISNVSGALAGNEIASAEYWVKHVRAPVEFAKGMQCLFDEGVNEYLELGPKPVLLGMAGGCIDLNTENSFCSLQIENNDVQFMLENLGKLYVQGNAINWQGLYADRAYRKSVLPTYPFQKKRYWVNKNDMSLQTNHGARSMACGDIEHPLIGRRMYMAGSSQLIYENTLDCHTLDYLNDHRVFDQVLFPGTGYVEMALAAGKMLDEFDSLTNVLLQQPLLIPEDGSKTIQSVLSPTDDGDYQIEIFSLTESASGKGVDWTAHMTGKIITKENERDTNRIDLVELQNICNESVSVTEYYSQFEQRGIVYGPMFKTIQSLWCSESQALAEIRLPDSMLLQTEDYHVHPALLDACFQVFGAAISEDKQNETYLPLGIDSVNFSGKPRSTVWVHAKFIPSDGGDLTLRADLAVMGADGERIVDINGLMLAKANRSSFAEINPGQLKRWLYEISWNTLRLQGKSLAPDFLNSPEIVENKLKDKYLEVLEEYDLDRYLPLYDELDKSCINYVVNALQQLGMVFEIGKSFKIEELADELCIIDEHKRQFTRLVDMLRDADIIALENDLWVIKSLPETSDPSAEIEMLHEQYPVLDAQLSLLINCGDNTADILRGDIDPLHIIFPNADTSLATRFYSEAPATQAMNEMVRRAIVAALENIPSGKKLRILEIGGGTGGTTAFILPHLNAEKVEYTYSDISAAFFANAKERFKEFDFIEFKMLNIENTPFDQGFIEQEFDLVVAANVLHATNNLSTTLQHAHQLLAPKGMMVLFEGTRSQYLVDMIFGWTEGWWRFEDSDLRKSHPLISLEKWRGVLNDVGFSQVNAFPSIDEPEKDRHHMGVIVAQRDFEVDDKILDQHSWLVLDDNSTTANDFVEKIEAQGDACIRIIAAEKFKRLDENRIELASNSIDDFNLLAEIINSDLANLKGVVDFWNLNVNGALTETGNEVIQSSEVAWGGVLNLVKTLSTLNINTVPRLWLITRGAQAIDNNIGFNGLLQSPVWGLAKVITMEYPEMQSTCIDLDSALPDFEAEMLAQEIWSNNNENQIAFRDIHRYASRMVRSNSDRNESESLDGKVETEQRDLANKIEINEDDGIKTVQLKAEATYLITGGLGGIGRTVARWMVERGASRIILVGRSAPDESVQTELDEIRGMGADIIIAQGDISNSKQLAKIISETQLEAFPLKGVVQSAGLLSDASLAQQDREKFIKVMEPKISGAWNLHQQTLDCDLDLFIVFSSVASLFGAPGQANHSASNAFLDMLAYYRQTLGLPGMSINWGAWAQVGSATHVTETNPLFKGVEAMEPMQALWAMEHLLTSKVSQAGVVPLDWSQLADRNVTMPLLSDLLKASNQMQVAPGGFLKQLEKAPVEERRELLVAFVRTQLIGVLGLDSGATIDTHHGLFDLGLDSLTSVEFRNRIQLALNCTLASTLAFNYPSIDAVVMYLCQSILEIDIPDSGENLVEASQADAEIEDTLEADVEDLSEQDLQQLLESELEQIKQDI
jgi:acyl transferase domain-containing protein/acyl carrier protein